MEKTVKHKRYWLLLLLILAGSVIYEPAYVRYNYYDIMAEALQLNNTQMGILMSIYGFGNVIFYFPGGWLADRFSCKKLIVISLMATGLGAFWFATFPSYGICIIIHLIWSAFNTLTFWAAMIKATRMLGDSSEQGKMFGILEGGRGLIPTLYGVAILAVFNALGAQLAGFQAVVICYGLLCIIGGLLVWAFFTEQTLDDSESQGTVMQAVSKVIKLPSVWLVALIIFCSYCAYIGQGYLTPYLTEMFGVSVSLSALIGLLRTYFIAVIAGPIGGLLADKVHSSVKILYYAFLFIIIGLILFLLIPASPNFMVPVFAAMLLVALAVFVTRGIYFAAIDEIDIPIQYTGAAVGFASCIGFIPDAFLYTVIGNWMDKNPGALGYKIMFGFLTGIGIVGLAVCWLLLRRIRRALQSDLHPAGPT